MSLPVIPTTVQQLFVFLLRSAQLTLSILIRQRATRLHLNTLYRITTASIVLLPILLSTTALLPEELYSYNRSSPYRFPSLGSGPLCIDTKRAAIPAFELTAALVLGSLYASSLARAGAPRDSSFCDYEETCGNFTQLFAFGVTLEALYVVTIVHWMVYLGKQAWAPEVRALVAMLWGFPRLCWRKWRGRSNQPAVVVVEKCCIPDAPGKEMQLYTLLACYPTLTSLVASLHYSDLLNLLLASKQSYHSIRSGSGGNISTLFTRTLCAGKRRSPCADCKTMLCRYEIVSRYSSPSAIGHDTYRNNELPRRHPSCALFCTRCRYTFFIRCARRGDDDVWGCSCQDVADGAVCGPSPGVVELCQRRRERRLVEAGRQIRKCARCGRGVQGWRWWVHFEREDLLAVRGLRPWGRRSPQVCERDCFDQRAHGE